MDLATITVAILRELFRHLDDFRALYREKGKDVITGPHGEQWSLWDVEYLLEQVEDLTERQRQAIVMGLIENKREKDIAIALGLNPDTAVMMYATEGLKKIVVKAQAGELPRFREGMSRRSS